MRVHYILAVAAVAPIVVGMKLMLSPPMKAEGGLTSMKVLQMQSDRQDLPIQKIRDMTFVFVDKD